MSEANSEKFVGFDKFRPWQGYIILGKIPMHFDQKYYYANWRIG